MRAIVVNELGGPDVLQLADRPDPQPRSGEVLLEVIATAVNHVDLLQRRDHRAPPPGASEILGLECSGAVAKLGENVTRLRVGDEVCALLAGGGYAQRMVVSAAQVMPLPPGVDVLTAAGLPKIAATVWSNFVMHARLTQGELLLVHRGSGGIGTHAIQVGVALGADVATTASARRLPRCAELGAQTLIDYERVPRARKGEADVDRVLLMWVTGQEMEVGPPGRAGDGLKPPHTASVKSRFWGSRRVRSPPATHQNRR